MLGRLLLELLPAVEDPPDDLIVVILQGRTSDQRSSGRLDMFTYRYRVHVQRAEEGVGVYKVERRGCSGK